MFNMENKVIICDNENKIKLLKTSDKLTHVKFYTLNEFINEIYFNINKNYIFYLSKKYNYNIELIMQMKQYFYYLNDEINIDNEKIKLLKNIKNELIENNYITFNNYIFEYLNKFDIVFYNLENTSDLKMAIKKLNENNINFKILNDNIEKKDITIFKYNTIEEEIEKTVIKIQQLLNSGVDINNIKIHSLSSNYQKLLKEYLDVFKIPNNILSKTKLSTFPIVTKFLTLISEYSIEESLLNINNHLKGIELEAYNKLVSILNNYDFSNNYEIDYPIIKYLCNHTNITYEYLTDYVSETSIKSISDDDYIFVLGFNNKEIISIKKDTDYLSDDLKKLINMDTSSNINNQNKESIIKDIIKSKNIILSYKLKTKTEECVIFDGIDILNDLCNVSIIDDNEILYLNINYNKIMYKKYMDNYRKFKIYNKDLLKLKNNVDIDEFDNSFSILNEENKKLLNEKGLNLSYTKIEKYNKCSFSYFLDYVLYLKDSDTKKMDIGNIFHSALYEIIKTENENYDELIEEFFTEYESDKTLSKKEKLFNEIYKKELKTVLEYINKYNKRSNFENAYLEKEIILDNVFEKDITIKGIIDKIMYFDDDNFNHALIIDYKTGSVDVSHDLIDYGINVQTLFYAYLVKESKIIKDLKIAGLYKQKALVNKKRNNANLLYKDLLKDEYKLNGITINNTDIIEEIDYAYEDDSYIKGIRVKKDGDLYKNKNLLANEEFDTYVDVVVSNIEKVCISILNGEFPINPKKDVEKDLSCEYCSHKDVCFKTKKDYITIQKEEVDKQDA